MLKLSIACAAVCLATGALACDQGTVATDTSGAAPDVVAREAEKRGGDDGKGHRLSDEMPASQVAREAEKRGHDDGKGHRLSDEPRQELLARAETSHGGKRRPAGKGGV